MRSGRFSVLAVETALVAGAVLGCSADESTPPTPESEKTHEVSPWDNAPAPETNEPITGNPEAWSRDQLVSAATSVAIQVCMNQESPRKEEYQIDWSTAAARLNDMPNVFENTHLGEFAQGVLADDGSVTTKIPDTLSGYASGLVCYPAE